MITVMLRYPPIAAGWTLRTEAASSSAAPSAAPGNPAYAGWRRAGRLYRWLHRIEDPA